MPSSSNVPITPLQQNLTAPTPQNTPLTSAPIAQGLSRPTVPDIEEGSSENDEDEEGEDDEGGAAIGELGGAQKLQAAMLSMVQNRLSNLIGKSSGYIESLPVEQKRTLEALKGLQGDWEGLQGKFKMEVLELEKKVNFFF
jgi:nucleosome assembly protein 1-like 1